METTLSQKELKKLSLNFRTVSSRLLRTSYIDGMANLLRFLNFIDETPPIKNYIDNCNYKFDVANEVKECASNPRVIYSIPTDTREEISFIYQILKYYSKNYESYLQPIPHAYCHSSSFQDQVDEFNIRVVLPFVNHINCFLEEQYIEFGDEALNNKITINNDSGQVNFAQNHANITATQNMNTEVIGLMEKFITQLQSEIFKNKEELQELTETVVEGIKSNTAKKTIISMLATKINEFITLAGVSAGALETAQKILPLLERLFN